MKVRHYIYRAYAADGRLLYVGQTIYPEQRITQHGYASPWFPEVAEWEFTEVGDWWQMQDAEREAIQTEHPIHNVAGKAKKEHTA